jgi:hypothetical protein
MPIDSTVQVSQSTSISQPPASDHSANAPAYLSWVGSSSQSIIASSAASTAAAAVRTRGGATLSNRSRTVDSSRTEPTNCRITPRPPDPVTTPSVGSRSPVTMRSKVVLPAPFGPTSAAF